VRNYCFFFSLLTGAAGLAGVVAAAAAGAAGAAPEAHRRRPCFQLTRVAASCVQVSEWYVDETIMKENDYCFFFSLLTGAAGLAGVVAAAAAGAAGAAPEAGFFRHQKFVKGKKSQPVTYTPSLSFPIPMVRERSKIEQRKNSLSHIPPLIDTSRSL
jgi:Flp pilus assembly protein CpaB